MTTGVRYFDRQCDGCGLMFSTTDPADCVCPSCISENTCRRCGTLLIPGSEDVCTCPDEDEERPDYWPSRPS